MLLAVCLLALLRRRWAASLALVAVGVGCAAWATVPDWGHSPGFGSSWYSVDTHVLSSLPRGAVVVTDQDAEPVSYAARWLASDAKIVPISQGIAYVQHPEDARVPGTDRMLGTGLDRAVRDELQRLSLAGRPFFILRGGRDPDLDLKPFGVVEDTGCLSLGGPDGQLRICPAHLDPSA